MHILLVEDNSADAHLLSEIFARKKNAPVIHWVADGFEALDYMFQRKQHQQAVRPDMILLDLNLPRINGYDVLKELKNHPTLANIPVIILTTSRNPLDHSQCKTLGADICFSKPHDLGEYEDMVRRLMSWSFLRLPRAASDSLN
jgi:CheY-like chemotaxis protein